MRSSVQIKQREGERAVKDGREKAKAAIAHTETSISASLRSMLEQRERVGDRHRHHHLLGGTREIGGGKP